MEVSDEAIRKNFQSKTETELVDLANSSQELTSEARSLLLEELRRRLAIAKQTAETVPLTHGWYVVAAPATGVKFPASCPRCSRLADDNSVQFRSSGRTSHFFRGKTSRAVSNIPHCPQCASELKQSRRVVSWSWGLVGILWIAAVVWFRIPRYAAYVASFIVFAPFVYLYDRTSAVKLGDSGDGLVEYHFRSHDYAQNFAALNHVQGDNTETLQSELENALARVQA